MHRAIPFVAALALMAAACGGGATTTTTTGSPGADAGLVPADTFPIVASTDLAVGTNRLLVALATPANQRPGGPDLPVTFRITHAESPEQVATYDTSWIWATPDVSGLYRAQVEFDRPGTWFVEVAVPGRAEPLEPAAFTVVEASRTPAIGEPAPPSDTPTAAAVADLSEITTDLDPDPRFYELSVADAVASGRATVVVFATPRFCQTAICGPTLDGIKEIAADHPEVNFVHVEVFTNLDDPDNLEVVPAVGEWGLTSEPWVFVVDGDGNVAGRFEGVADRQEIEEALAS